MVAYNYSKGYKIYYDDDKQDWLYSDDNTTSENIRPCKRCGKHETDKGYDPCLGYLGDNVKSACCGHGAKKGYIVFKDGRRFEEIKR